MYYLMLSHNCDLITITANKRGEDMEHSEVTDWHFTDLEVYFRLVGNLSSYESEEVSVMTP